MRKRESDDTYCHDQLSFQISNPIHAGGGSGTIAPLPPYNLFISTCHYSIGPLLETFGLDDARPPAATPVNRCRLGGVTAKTEQVEARGGEPANETKAGF